MSAYNLLKFKIPFITFLLGSLFVISYTALDNYLLKVEMKKVLFHNAMAKITEREEFIKDKLQVSQNILFSLRESQFFKNYLENQDEKDIKILFQSVIKAHGEITQIRFIDAKGMEKIRFDRKNKDIFEITQLQDKSSRYYFKKNKDKDEKIWFSDLDLNVENNKVEVPFNSTYRVVLPVQENGIFQGILILNHQGKELLNRLFHMPSYDGILVDKEGYILYHYNPKNNWSRYQEKPFRLSKEYKEIFGKEQFQTNQFVSKRFHTPFGNELYMVLELSDKTISEQEILHQRKVTTSIAIFVIFVLIGSVLLYFLLNRFEKQKEQIRILNEKKDIVKNLLIQKSKMAAMGEMIANIAHQWRQPLTIISMQLISLEAKILKNSLTNEHLENCIATVSQTVQSMNQTIEDFSRFFNPNKEKKEFELETTIKEALKIVSKNFKDNGLTVVFNEKEKSMYNGYKNEFIQVFINILNNSKDAIEMNNIKNGLVTIDIFKTDEFYLITVLDNGGGIPLDIQERVFEPYFTTKFKSNGTGIGLYMCKMIIEDSLKGEITLENKQDGALCTIKLPRGEL